MMSPSQRTVCSNAVMQGIGLHTGENCRIELLPAEIGAGVVFVSKNEEIKAVIANVQDTNRGITLCGQNSQIHTVEHLLAALAGMGVDNVVVKVDGPEIPAADGSALPFVELIESAGIVIQAADADTVRLSEPVWVADGSKYLLATPSEHFRANALISFQHPLIGDEALSLVLRPEVFKREIAPARTFCTSSEIEMIYSLGLGKGGTEDNVIVVYEDHYSVPLRFKDEFVRHKVLDLIGDLSLIGRRLHADVTAIKSSHALNIALANKITQQLAGGQQGG